MKNKEFCTEKTVAHLFYRKFAGRLITPAFSYSATVNRTANYAY
jgi:hypothetical protein